MVLTLTSLAEIAALAVPYKLVEQRDARVLIVELGQLAHDLAAALVLQVRNDDFDGDDLVAALARDATRSRRRVRACAAFARSACRAES